MIKDKKFKKWFTDQLRNKIFCLVVIRNKIKVKYNNQILKNEDLIFLYDVHKKQSR